MARRAAPGSGVMRCIEDCCGLYDVPFYRMQSRMFNVEANDSRGYRPMAVGKWRDRFGKDHVGGMPDFLLTPRILAAQPFRLPVPLWVEAKEGPNARLSPKQREFRDDVLSRGGLWLVVHDGPEALLSWFKEFGVEKL